jgi:hypothetical protein
MTNDEKIFDVFLSHSNLDAILVEELAKQLEDHAKLNVWLDRWILVPGEHWQQEMARGLDNVKSCVVCIGEQTPKGWFQEEIERSINRQSRDSSFRVIPLLLPKSQAIKIDNFLELRTWVDFNNGLDDKKEFHRLVCGIKGVAPGRGPKDDTISESIQMRKKLIQLHKLRIEGLIGEDIELEYQRKILDRDLLMER